MANCSSTSSLREPASTSASKIPSRISVPGLARGQTPTMSTDPVASNPAHYKVVLENDQVRVLEYTDAPR